MLHLCLPAFALLVSLAAAQLAAPVPVGLVHRVDAAALAAHELDALRDLPGVGAWLECGDVVVLVGDERLGPALATLPAARWSVVPGAAQDLRLARGAARACLDGATVVAGCGRDALLLVEPGARATPPELELQTVPWNSAPVLRADRSGPPPAAATTPLVAAAVAAVDRDAWAASLSGLVALGPRVTTAASFPAGATATLEAQFQALGYATTLDPFSISGKTRHNVLAELPGDVTPGDVVIVCGHYDSVAAGPGADDNASGAAAVVEAARVLRPYRFASTLRFIGFAGEEQGLVGSKAYVNDLVAAGQLGSVRAVINLDMIAYRNSTAFDVLLEGKAGVSAPLLALLAGLAPQYTSLVAYTSTNPYGSDHIPFLDKNVNAVLLIEYEDWLNPWYHSAGDTLAKLDLDFGLEVVKLEVAAAAVQAGIHGGYMLAYGEGLAGSGGQVPRLSGSGSANLGEDLVLHVEEGLGGAAGLLWAGLAPAALPFKGGMLRVDSTGALTIAVALGGTPGAPGAGGLDLPASVPPDPALDGVSAWLQAALADPGALYGVALSNGLELAFGT